MDRNVILEMISQEISRLEQVRQLLGSQNGLSLVAGRASKASGGAKKRVLSEDARNRIAQAQKRRWAKQRREALLAKKAS